jgi:hypothetical protein
MAKVFIVLLSVLVVLNGMTFLVVVNQGSAPGQGGSPREADAAAKKPQGPDPTAQKMESIERAIQGVKGSMDRLSSKVDGLQAKVNQVASRPTIAPAAAQALPPPTGVPSQRPISPVRRGPVDYSRIAAPQASGSQPAAEEEASEEGPAAAEPEPAAEEPAAESSEDGAAQTPAAEEGEGAAPAEGDGESP